MVQKMLESISIEIGESTMWEILDTGIGSAVRNMQIDADLLEGLDQRPRPILHFYEWETDSATYGYFTDPARYLNLSQANERGLSLARRSTGGGIVFHLWDMAFSVLVPSHCPEFSSNTLENYAFVNQAVLGAVESFLNRDLGLYLTEADFEAKGPSCSHFCMAKPTKYDVILEGRKIAGAAQRKTKAGFLHQGTLSLVMPSQDFLDAVLISKDEVRAAMQAFTFPLLGASATEQQMLQAQEELKELLTTHLTQASVNYPIHQTPNI
jgi:lipoate-protein ligase A